MKRLGVFVCTMLATLVVFGVFSSPVKVFAQTPPATGYDSKTFTHEIAQNSVLPLFDTTISALNKDLNDTSQLKTESGIQVYNREKVLVPQLLKIVGDAKNAYTSSYNTNLSPSKAQIAALSEVNKVINSGVPVLRGISGLPSIWNGFTNQIGVAMSIATEIDSGRNSGGLTTDPSAVTNVQQQVSTTRQQAEEEGCNFWSWTIGACINEGITWLIKSTLLQIGGFLVWLTANMFNKAVQIGILNFKDWAPDTLYPVWIIVRQIISLIIVFVGLYLGFMYILGREDKFEKYIPWVIIFGLFVNFSYPITRTIIDVSNIVSLNVYASAVGSDTLGNNVNNPHTAGALIMNRLGLQELAMSASAVSSNKDTNILKNVKTIPGALVAVAFVFYAAYIFFMVTAIMVVRTLALVFITITSPLLLVDSVLPLLGEQAKKMRKIFFEQIIVGPVFMIMLALTLKFLEVFSKNSELTGRVGVANLGGGGVDSVTTFFNILMMLIMLHIMLKVTKSVSGAIGQYATDAMGKVGGFGLGVASGGTGMLARKTLGAAALKVRDSNWVNSNPGNFLARRTYDLSNSVAKSTFDLRNSKTVAGGLGKIGMGVGMGTKMTAETESDNKIKKINERAARIKTRYERDTYKKDEVTGQMVIDKRKGEVNVDNERVRNEYLENKGGSIFLTKEEKDRLKDPETDKKSEETLVEYNKLGDKKGLDGKPEKKRFEEKLRKDLEELLKTDKNAEKVETRAILRTLDVITKENKTNQEAFNKAVEDALDRYNRTSDDKKKDFLPTVKDKAVRDEVAARIEGKRTQASTTNNEAPTPNAQATPSPQPQPQEAPQKAGETPGFLKTAEDKIRERGERLEREKKEASQVDLTKPFNSGEDLTTLSYAERAAAKRAAAQKLAAAQAQKEMAQNQGTPAPSQPANTREDQMSTAQTARVTQTLEEAGVSSKKEAEEKPTPQPEKVDTTTPSEGKPLSDFGSVGARRAAQQQREKVSQQEKDVREPETA